MRIFFSVKTIVFFSIISLALSSCATVTRGSYNEFVVQTIPAGAKVTTDLIRNKDRTGAIEYYSCPATPCSIKLPRRSDFNVMITLSGFQPFTYAITKERNKEAAKRNNKTVLASSAATTGGLAVGSIMVASMFTNLRALATVSAPTAIAGTATVTALYAGPVIGAAAGIDLASGSLIDLYPNPLVVQLAPESTPEQTKELITMFENTRADQTKP